MNNTAEVLLKDCPPEHPYLLSSAVETRLKGNLMGREVLSCLARMGMYPVVSKCSSAPHGWKLLWSFVGLERDCEHTQGAFVQCSIPPTSSWWLLLHCRSHEKPVLWATNQPVQENTAYVDDGLAWCFTLSQLWLAALEGSLSWVSCFHR